MKVRLELDLLRIHASRENWQIYFVLVSEDPIHEGNWLIRSLPGSVIRIKKPAENEVSFRAEGTGADGLLLLESEVQADDHLMVRLFILHSRSKFRTNQELTSELLEEVQLSRINTVAGLTGPWLRLGLEAFPIITRYLAKIGDRDLGMVSMDERFKPVKAVLKRKNHSSTGEVELAWRWITEN